MRFTTKRGNVFTVRLRSSRHSACRSREWARRVLVDQGGAHRTRLGFPVAIPSSAFNDRTGITPTSVSVATISWQQIFKSAVGVQAYSDYVNSQGGVDGRKLVTSGDDGDSGATNKQLTQASVSSDFATVGSFSLQDGFGGTVLAANRGVPNVSPPWTPPPRGCPTASVRRYRPAAGSSARWPTSRPCSPATVTHAGRWSPTSSRPPPCSPVEQAAMDHLGYNLAYDQTFDVTQQDFNQNVVAMRNDGVKILFIEQMPQNYAGAVIKALNQQNFHPVVVLGASTYSEAIGPLLGRGGQYRRVVYRAERGAVPGGGRAPCRR